jgi:hypothetical protein
MAIRKRLTHSPVVDWRHIAKTMLLVLQNRQHVSN